MEFKEYKLRDIVDVLNKIINPQKNKNTNFSLYSLPAFDNNKTPEICKGEQINSSKLIIDRQAILFNKLNIRFKRIWNLTSINSNSICSMEFIPLVANQKIILNDYLYYLLISDGFNKGLIENSTGTSNSHQRINKEILLEKNIYLPSIENQKKITYILKSIDKKIELNNQIKDNLFKMCNATYHDYLNKHLELIENKKIIEIASKVVTGKTPSTKNEEFWKGNIPFITIPDMHNQIFTINTARKINEVSAKAVIPKYSILVSCIATVGLVSISTERAQTNQQINSIVLNNEYDLYYLFEFLSEQESFMKNIASGSTTYNINKNTFGNIEVPYLPSDKIMEFHNIVNKMFEKIKLNQLENETLEQLKNTLLPKLMNGEINLENIEI